MRIRQKNRQRPLTERPLERTMRAVYKTVPYLFSLLFVLSCGDENTASSDEANENEKSARVAAAAMSDDYSDEPRPIVSESTKTVIRDLRAEAHRAYVGRNGLTLGPGLPGWEQVSQLTGRGPWSPVRQIEKKSGSFLKGHGATIAFPVGMDGPGMRTLSLWLWPARKGQFVSVYLDEKLLGTPRLKSGWNRYDFALPASGLALGEHTVRLWFRKLGKVGRRVTPGALGMIRLSKAVETTAHMNWLTPDESPSWRAGPPSSWSIDLMIPPNAHLDATGLVQGGDSVKFSVHLSRDGGGSIQLAAQDAVRGQTASLSADLGPWSGQMVRLSLRTQGPSRPLDQAIWSDVSLKSDIPQESTVSEVKNVVLMVAPGLWADGFMRRLEQAHKNSALKLLSVQSSITDDTWSGGIKPEDIHRRILGVQNGSENWVKTLQNSGVSTALWSITRDFPKGLKRGFTTVHKGQGAPPDYHQVFDGIDEWLYARSRNRFFFYLDLPPVESGKRSRTMDGFDREDEDAEHLDAVHRRIDFWLAQTVGILSAHRVLEETAIILVGAPGQYLSTFKGTTLSPSRLSVPLVLWHPQHRGMGPKFPLRGTDTRDIGATALSLLGVSADFADQSRDLAGALLNGEVLSHASISAKTRFGWTVRTGPWTYWPRAKRAHRLWHRDDPDTPRPIDDYPITVRALRDRIADVESSN